MSGWICNFTTGSSRPVFAVGDRFGYVLRLLLVGRCLGEEQPFYGLQPPGMSWESAGLSTIPQFAAHYIEQLRVIQPDGPYRFLGASFGGLVVYEMALQLQSAGQEVELLALVDTYPTTCRIHDRLDRTDPLLWRGAGRGVQRNRGDRLPRGTCSHACAR